MNSLISLIVRAFGVGLTMGVRVCRECLRCRRSPRNEVAGVISAAVHSGGGREHVTRDAEVLTACAKLATNGGLASIHSNSEALLHFRVGRRSESTHKLGEPEEDLRAWFQVITEWCEQYAVRSRGQQMK